ncbi:hypothetical protein LAZ67_7001454 [Cordylochernes scorpioides]|uniref:RNase H type-1 domain-containing protein n=1 Tax=Cordylochernes scorpioides TaxID=51811 RepID=A0ABY6KME3_9ARAC|nr:hypothetical protein LAZ67_7001454 [Cordylochernes scorpioides]
MLPINQPVNQTLIPIVYPQTDMSLARDMRYVKRTPPLKGVFPQDKEALPIPHTELSTNSPVSLIYQPIPTNMKLSQNYLKALGLQIIEENSTLFDITIYTDSSQLETGLSGSVIAIYKEQPFIPFKAASPVKSLLKSIAKSVNRLPANSSVTMQWLPAHVGIPGNELADSLAKAGALGLPEARESTTQLDERDLLRTIKNQCSHEWKSNAAQTGTELEGQAPVLSSQENNSL